MLRSSEERTYSLLLGMYKEFNIKVIAHAKQFLREKKDQNRITREPQGDNEILVLFMAMPQY